MAQSQDQRTSGGLSVPDAVVIVIGVVVGAGIFKTPSLVAGSAGSEEWLLLVWVVGGVISLAGGLCYSELASAYPGQGGEYHYLTRAFGTAPGFLFAWARLGVIQTGSIAMLAFLIGDYGADLAGPLNLSSAGIAAVSVLLLTALNVIGMRQGKWMQWLLVCALTAGLIGIVLAGALHPGTTEARGEAAGFLPGRAMIFVLLTFGGWNEAAYLSAEVRTPRNMVRVLTISIVLITALYLGVNLALLKGLGLAGMAQSEAVATDIVRSFLGERSARVVGAFVVIAALSTMNATMITGARTAFALGQDFPRLRFLGHWRQVGETPANALLVQGGVALLLVAAGSRMRSGFEAMVDYTAPVFWLFFLLAGLSLFVLRRREPGHHRPFRVPLYPWLPLFFCTVCLAMLGSSLVFTGIGALAGLAVLVSGIPFFWVFRQRPVQLSTKEKSP